MKGRCLTRGLGALGFAVLAPLGLILEALIGEKHLLAGGEDELLTTFRALQDLIVVFHTLLRGSALVQSPQHPRPVRLCWDTPGMNVGPNSNWSKGA
ncbi:MAG TPA: hypothetical protein VGT24_13825 [Candidatus Acidoferrales bacterium]|nr:hypothetical protein [Candidatus Acidoferrales bacterium]